MKAFLFALLFTLPGCGLFRYTPPQPAEAPQAPEVDVIARAINNTVRLVDEDTITFCSGVMAEGVVISAHHCIEDGKPFVIETRDGKEYQGLVAFTWPNRDLAILTAVGLKMKDTVPLADDPVVLGQRIVWMGFPLGRTFQLGVGVVSNDSPNETYFDIQGQIIPGNSGGPVFNEFGRLVGIISATTAIAGAPFPQMLPIGHVIRWENIKSVLDAL